MCNVFGSSSEFTLKSNSTNSHQIQCREITLCHPNRAFPNSQDFHRRKKLSDTVYLFNPFVSNEPFLHSLKTLKNREVFWCFQGVEKGCIGNKWVKSLELLEEKNIGIRKRKILCRILIQFFFVICKCSAKVFILVFTIFQGGFHRTAQYYIKIWYGIR